MYFLIVGFVMWIGTRFPHLFNSAFSPVTTWGPIAIFISISLLSEGIADKKRHVSDYKTNTFRCIVVENATADATPVSDSMATSMNNSMVKISANNRKASAVADETAQNEIPWDDVDVSVHGGNTTASFHPIRRKDIRQGHIIVVRNREMIPADIVLLASSGDRGCAYIETSSIDGETNLKLRLSAKHKTDPNFNQAHESIEEAVRRIAGFTAIGFQYQQNPASGIDRIAELTTEPPDAHINTFSGLLKLPGLTTVDEEEPNPATTHRELPLGADHLLLRGAVLRNTEWAIGIACFTGTDTKLSQNTIETPSKFSQLDLITNKCVIVMIFIELICIIYLSTLAVIINRRNIKELWCVRTRSSD
jgi:magnesium-transporting ATPase (P-type)